MVFVVMMLLMRHNFECGIVFCWTKKYMAGHMTILKKKIKLFFFYAKILLINLRLFPHSFMISFQCSPYTDLATELLVLKPTREQQKLRRKKNKNRHEIEMCIWFPSKLTQYRIFSVHSVLSQLFVGSLEHNNWAERTSYLIVGSIHLQKNQEDTWQWFAAAFKTQTVLISGRCRIPQRNGVKRIVISSTMAPPLTPV